MTFIDINLNLVLTLIYHTLEVTGNLRIGNKVHYLHAGYLKILWSNGSLGIIINIKYLFILLFNSDMIPKEVDYSMASGMYYTPNFVKVNISILYFYRSKIKTHISLFITMVVN